MFGTLHLGLRLVTYSPHGNAQRSAAVVLKNNHKTMTVNSTNELSFKDNTITYVGHPNLWLQISSDVLTYLTFVF